MNNEQLDLFVEAEEAIDQELAVLDKDRDQEGKTEEGITVTYEDYPIEDLMTYAGIDCIATSGIAAAKWPELVAAQTMKFYVNEGGIDRVAERSAPSILRSVEQIEMPAHEFIIDLEINGIGYSVERNRFFHEKMVNHIAELDDRIYTGAGKKIDLNSGLAVSEFLYGELGFEVPYFTKGGEPATDGTAILALVGLKPDDKKLIAKNPNHQWLVDMAIRKDVSGAHNTFIKDYLKWVKRDGRIHPSYNLFGTSSFRITGSDPNLTQLPREKHGYNIRTCFIERDENGEEYVFISFDFSSAEVKILANMAKEENMLKAIADGLDFHTFSASAMRNIPYDEMAAVLADQSHPEYKNYKQYRQLAKVLTFSILYGSSDAGIARQLFLELDEAKRLIELYFTTFPKIRQFIEDSHKMAMLNQQVITPLGQRKRQFGTLPQFKFTASYNASLRNSQNVLIQSTTSSIGLITFAELNERIKPYGAKSTCTVYDSLEIRCPLKTAHEVINLAYDVLNKWPVETFDFMELPIGCEGDVGISWGETKVVHEGTTAEDVISIIKKLKTESIQTFGMWIP